MRHCFACSALFAVCVFGIARPASADLTAFVGTNQTPSNRPTRGVALGLSLLVVGFEFEYSETVENRDGSAPSLQTSMFNMHLLTPFGVSGLQFYGTMGGGVYRERLDNRQETSAGANVGGGLKMSLAGPIRVRFDYRIFTLRGRPLHA